MSSNVNVKFKAILESAKPTGASITPGMYYQCTDTGRLFLGMPGASAANNYLLEVHANNVATAGTYRSVTVNAQGHVTAGTNPTTIAGYGITDAKIASGVITLGSNTITPLTSSSTLNAANLSGAIPTTVTQTNWDAAYTHSQSAHARTDATAVTASTTNGNIKIDGTETTVYTHPTTAGNKHIPSGGSSGQFLGYDSAGTAKWVSNPNTNQTVKVGSSTFVANAAVAIAAGSNVTVTPDTTNNTITIASSYTDTNQKVKAGSTTFGNNDVVEIAAGTNVTVTPDSTNKKITIAATNTTYSEATTSVAGLMSASDKTKLNGIATGAEVNQNAFSNVKVGTTTVAADAKTDTLELVAGNNITLTPDATNDKITIAATDTTYTVGTTTVPNVTSVGSVPTLGTAIPADDITAWTTNTPTAISASVNSTNACLEITYSAGSAASLSYTAKSIPNVTSVGSAPTLGTAITVVNSVTAN